MSDQLFSVADVIWY